MHSEMLIKLPEELKAFYQESGYLPTTAIENRTNARLRVRRDGQIEFTYRPPILKGKVGFRSRTVGDVLIKDLSKAGIGVLYHEQIFPEEKFNITFQGRLMRVCAVRCRRLCEDCYEVGGLIESVVSLDVVE